MYRSLARWCHHRPKLVVLFWIALIVGINVTGAVVGPSFDSSFSSPGSESSRGFATIVRSFPGAGSQIGGSVVFTGTPDARTPVTDDSIRKPITAFLESVGRLDGVSVVSPYSELGTQQISPDRTVAFAQINLAPDLDSNESAAIGKQIRALAPSTGLRVEVGGAALAPLATPKTELIGVAFAIIVLIVAFGSVLAMGLPIGVALAGVASGGIGAVTLLSNVLTVPEFATFIGLMIGLGVGIDYALLIVTRYRELSHAGWSGDAAIEEAMDTAGRAVVVAGLTVVVSLLGMVLIGMGFITGLGVGASVTVAATVAASLTLLPALLSLSGPRLELTRWRGLIGAGSAAVALFGVGINLPRIGAVGAIGAAVVLLPGFVVTPLKRAVPHRPAKERRQTLAYRWSRLVQARPKTGVLVGGGLLLVLSAPIVGLRLGFSDDGNYPKDTTTRAAYDLIAKGFGPGFNGPLLLAVTTSAPSSTADASVVEALTKRIASVPGVDRVSAAVPDRATNPTAYLLQIIPTSSPQDEETDRTVQRVRVAVREVVESTNVRADLTGAVPANIDVSGYLSKRIVIFFAAVLAISFLLLMMVFRSVLVPVKAVVMNMLSISAAYGVIVAVFQWGWFGGLTGIEPAPIEPFIPMMLFAIVFGLSMDYEVFLLSRVKEEYDRTGDPVGSVADGLAATARVITAAAAIMVVVFGSFLFEDNRITKLFGSGLALAVFLDATLVRMLLVPATMELLGARNWWMPKWLDRILPRVHVESSVSNARVLKVAR